MGTYQTGKNGLLSNVNFNRIKTEVKRVLSTINEVILQEKQNGQVRADGTSKLALEQRKSFVSRSKGLEKNEDLTNIRVLTVNVTLLTILGSSDTYLRLPNPSDPFFSKSVCVRTLYLSEILSPIITELLGHKHRSRNQSIRITDWVG